jgi:hypothetical protein
MLFRIPSGSRHATVRKKVPSRRRVRARSVGQGSDRKNWQAGNFNAFPDSPRTQAPILCLLVPKLQLGNALAPEAPASHRQGRRGFPASGPVTGARAGAECFRPDVEDLNGSNQPIMMAKIS